MVPNWRPTVGPGAPDEQHGAREKHPMSLGSNGSHAAPSEERLSVPLKLLAELMRRLPTDIRRADVIWQGLYRRIGGGGFAPDQAVDRRWPSGLQAPIRGGHRLLMRLDLRNWSDRRVYFSGRYYQPDLTRLLESLLRPGDQYVDIGANIGMTALLARSKIGAAGKGVAFEPNPVAFARLKDHFAINGVTNFELVPRAVADCESVQWLFVPGGEMGLGTLAPEKAEGTRVEVRTEPADRYVAALDPAKPTLIKIDVEGFEVQVLKGLGSLLERQNLMLVTEISGAKLRRAGHSRDELHALLSGFGLVPHAMTVRASRWRKELELSPMPGPLDTEEEYDALFARPGSPIFGQRIEPLLAGTGQG
jgi:FkbM family methyltransferase